jgi:flavin-binding protein dodecin
LKTFLAESDFRGTDGHRGTARYPPIEFQRSITAMQPGRHPASDQREKTAIPGGALHDGPRRRLSVSAQEDSMMVRKAINLAASGPTIEAAVQEAIDRATTTLEGVTRFEVSKIGGELTDSGQVFDIELTVWFNLLERMHE